MAPALTATHTSLVVRKIDTGAVDILMEKLVTEKSGNPKANTLNILTIMI